MKKVTFYATLYLLIFTGAGLSQPEIEWSTEFAQRRSIISMAKIAGGNLLLSTYSPNIAYNFSLINLSNDHDVIWAGNYDQSYAYGAKTVVQIPNGGFAAAGRTISYGPASGDYFIVRVNNNGELDTFRTYGGSSDEECQSMVATWNGQLILAGYTASFGQGNVDGWILKTDQNGDSLWSRTFGGAAYDCFFKVIPTADRNYVTAGSSKSYDNGAGDFWLTKFSPEGDSIWSKTYGSEREDLCYDVAATVDSGFVLVGSTRALESNSLDFFILKTDKNGDSLWCRVFGTEEPEQASAVITTLDGGIAVLGSRVFERNLFEDWWLVKLDDSGDSLWSQRFAGGYHDWGKALLQLGNGKFVIGGNNDENAWLVITTPDPVNGVDEDVPYYPASITLYPAYPNPFNSMVTIPFAVGAHRDAPLQLAIFDPLGRRVVDLIGSTAVTGGRFLRAAEGGATNHSIVWNANGMPAGHYTVRLQAPGVTLSQPLVLTK